VAEEEDASISGDLIDARQPGRRRRSRGDADRVAPMDTAWNRGAGASLPLVLLVGAGLLSRSFVARGRFHEAVEDAGQNAR
jgi:hypothetical protein